MIKKKLRHVLLTQVFDSATIATPSTLANFTCYFYCSGGLAVLISVILPGWTPGANLLGLAALGMIAMVSGAFVFVFGSALPKWTFGITVMGGTALISIGVLCSGSPDAAICVACLYFYVIFDCALFFGMLGMISQFLVTLIASVVSLIYMNVEPAPLAFLEISMASCMLATAWIARVIHMPERDQLTKLLNRRMFETFIEQALKHPGETGQVCVAYIDLDHFNEMNLQQGEVAADEMLRKIAHTWTRNLPKTVHLARMAGDRFAMMLTGSSTGQTVRITDELRSLLPQGITASAGVAAQEDGDTPSALILRAENASLQAKTYGRNNTAVFGDPDRRASSLEAALLQREFVLEYQPVFRIPERTIASYEALIRWRQPGRDQVSPAYFIPLAEKTGVIHAIGQWVLTEAAKTIALNTVVTDNADPSRPPWPCIAVNASMLELRAPGYAQSVAQVVQHYGLRPGQLTIEVTESLFDGDHPTVLSTIETIKKLGVKIAIDDFGTGYSSLRWLDRYPIDILKIDKSFVDPITDTRQELKVLRGIVSLGRALNLTILAEGIENELQAGVLQQLGVQRFQGFLLGRPMPLNTDGSLPGTIPPEIAELQHRT